MSVRLERIKAVIKEEVAELILHDLSDPRIGFCTVTRVELTNDLSFSTIHVSVLGDDAQKNKTIRGLQDARGLIQKRVASRLKTRTTPHIEIELDDSVERAFRVMDKIKEARATDPDGGKSTEEELPKPGKKARDDEDED